MKVEVSGSQVTISTTDMSMEPIVVEVSVVHPNLIFIEASNRTGKVLNVEVTDRGITRRRVRR